MASVVTLQLASSPLSIPPPTVRYRWVAAVTLLLLLLGFLLGSPRSMSLASTSTVPQASAAGGVRGPPQATFPDAVRWLAPAWQRRLDAPPPPPFHLRRPLEPRPTSSPWLALVRPPLLQTAVALAAAGFAWRRLRPGGRTSRVGWEGPQVAAALLGARAEDQAVPERAALGKARDGSAVDDSPEARAKRKAEKRSKSQDPSMFYSKPSKTSRETVLDFLVRRFPYHTPPKWQEVIAGGSVYVNGERAAEDLVLDTNDRVSYRSSAEEPPVDRTFGIVYQDDDLLVVRKSGRIPVAEGGRYYQNVLVRVVEQALGQQTGREERLFTVQRLDRETSGTVVFCRSLEACQRVSEQFMANAVTKVYYAVLVGDLAEEQDCKLPLLRLDTVQPLPPAGLPQVHRLRVACHPDGKPAHTRFTPVLRAGGLTLCRVHLFTGRTHQIRAHAEGLGHPLLGDKLYGQTDQAFMELTMGLREPVFPPFGRVPRHLLHAADIHLRHPTTAAPLHFTTDYAAAFAECPYVVEHLLPRPLPPTALPGT